MRYMKRARERERNIEREKKRKDRTRELGREDKQKKYIGRETGKEREIKSKQTCVKTLV